MYPSQLPLSIWDNWKFIYFNTRENMLKQVHISDLRFLILPLPFVHIDLWWWWRCRSVRFNTNPGPGEEQTILVVFWSKLWRSEQGDICNRKIPPDWYVPVSSLAGLLGLTGVELRPAKLGSRVLHLITGLCPLVPLELVYPDLAVSFPLEKYPRGFRVCQGW